MFIVIYLLSKEVRRTFAKKLFRYEAQKTSSLILNRVLVCEAKNIG